MLFFVVVMVTNVFIAVPVPQYIKCLSGTQRSFYLIFWWESCPNRNIDSTTTGIKNMDQQQTTYKFCPIGGIVCNRCKYPVKDCKDGFMKAIVDHETKNKQHDTITPKADRKLLISEFHRFIEELARELVATLPDENAARSKLLFYMDDVNDFPYCTKCELLVDDKRKHQRDKHASFCHGEKVSGHQSKYWKKLQPKIISNEFILHHKQNYCTTLWKAVHSEFIMQQKTFPGVTDVVIQHRCNNGGGALIQIMQEQQTLITATEHTLRLQYINQTKDPNLWVNRAGWYEYLHDFEPNKIHSITTPFNEQTESNEKKNGRYACNNNHRNDNIPSKC